MRAFLLLMASGLAASALAAGDPVPFDSPGFAPSRMDADGRLVEDWGPVSVKLSGEGLVDGPVQVAALRLDDVIPAAQAVANRGAVRLTWTAFRAPAFPAGVDVLTVRVEEIKGQPAKVAVSLDVPAGATIGLSTVRIDKRVILSVPRETYQLQEVGDWGYSTETTPMRGWAKPEGKCDPAFGNIRAGMGGVPIEYRFKVAPGSQANVVLGFCESHWAKPRQRPLQCRVEGAAWQEVDPVARWGQHKPGVLLFKARDENQDGRIELAVRPAPGAKDRNPILNAIWLFPPGKPPTLGKVMAGDLNAEAIRYVDVGGESDPSIYAAGKLDYPVELAAGGAKDLTFYLACPNDSAPLQETTTWTPATLRRAAREVWQGWASR